MFAGNYHGATDALLAAGGSGVATLGLPGSAGVPASAVADTMVVPYNVVPQLDERVAAVIVEPVAANMGLVAPGARLPRGLRAECDRVGALLVFDEVITGFRLGPRRRPGAVRRARPTSPRFGKVIGGGLPIGAVGGRREIMETLSPLGPGVPGRHAVRQPAGHRRRPRRARTSSSRRRLHRARGRAPARSSRMLADACAAAGIAAHVPGRRHAGRHVLRRRHARRPTSTRPRPPTSRSYRHVLPRHARRGRGAGAGRLRGAVRRAGPRPTTCSTRSAKRPASRRRHRRASSPDRNLRPDAAVRLASLLADDRRVRRPHVRPLVRARAQGRQRRRDRQAGAPSW